MCRATAGPLLAMVGVAGTAAGVAIAIVREKVDRRADARAARHALEEQGARDFDSPGSGQPEDSDSEPVETEPGASRSGDE